MNRAGIIHTTYVPLTNDERRSQWYAKAALLGLLILGPRTTPRQALVPALPCPAQGLAGAVVLPMRKRASAGERRRYYPLPELPK